MTQGLTVGCAVPVGTDYHPFRCNLITGLEHAEVYQVEIARHVGHKVGTMAGDTYSASGDKRGAIKTAKSIRYSKTTEDAVVSFVNRSQPGTCSEKPTSTRKISRPH